jgi:hypothetical protein
MPALIEYVLENYGTRYLPYDPAQLTRALMQDHADEALRKDAIQVTFVDHDGVQAIFEREDA